MIDKLNEYRDKYFISINNHNKCNVPCFVLKCARQDMLEAEAVMWVPVKFLENGEHLTISDEIMGCYIDRLVDDCNALADAISNKVPILSRKDIDKLCKQSSQNTGISIRSSWIGKVSTGLEAFKDGKKLQLIYVPTLGGKLAIKQGITNLLRVAVTC